MYPKTNKKLERGTARCADRIMRPRERRETSEQDLFRSRLDQIIDLNHAVVKLARAIDWCFLEERFGSVYTDGPGRPTCLASETGTLDCNPI
jgi:hypothetical protein